MARIKSYIDRGKFEIDNNKIKNDIPSIVLERKNYLFAGLHSDAQKAAMIYSSWLYVKLMK